MELISRQEAIDAVCMEWCGVKHQDCKHPFDDEEDDYYWCDGCECEKCGALFIVPQHMEQAKQPEKSAD